MEREDKVSEQKLNNYFSLTQQALKKLKIAAPEESHLRKIAEDYLDMAQRYFEDAQHFRKKGDFVTAFASLNYAHGWLDAGARLGIFDVDRDSRLFTVG